MEERHRLMELASENEVRALLALDGANVGLWEWDLATNRWRWSNGTYRLHGLEPSTAVDHEVWRAAIHPDDRARVARELENAQAEGGAFSSEYRVSLPADEVRWVVSQGNFILAGNKPQRMFGYCGDVTRRKHSDMALLQSEKL